MAEPTQTENDIIASMIVPSDAPNAPSTPADELEKRLRGSASSNSSDANAEDRSSDTADLSVPSSDQKDVNSADTDGDTILGDASDDEDTSISSDTPDGEDAGDDQEQDLAASDDAPNDEDGEDYDPLSDLFDAEGGDEERQGNQHIDPTALGDDLELSVTVDGEDVKVSLGDLKSRYAGEGAIEKRLQAATEARDAAFKTYERGQAATQAALEKLGAAMFRRTVPEPDAALRATDATQYLLQKDQYDAETQQLTAQQHELMSVLQEVDATFEEAQKQQREQARTELRRMMPALNDPVKGPKVRTALVDAAREIGFSDEAIRACTDPLIFKTVALAARELRRQRATKIERGGQTKKVLKSTAAGRNKSGNQSAQRENQRALKQARETGNEADIIASMIVKN